MPFKESSRRPVEWVIAFISAVASWQIIDDINLFIKNFIIILGAEKGGILYMILMWVSMPFIFVIITLFALRFYEEIIWPRFSILGCKKGWFVYDLISMKDNENLNEIKGYFYLNDRINLSEIVEGRAYFYENKNLRFRGGWSGRVIWINPKKMQCIFSMAEGNDTYQGFFTLSMTSYRSGLGIDVWEGRFFDIGKRIGIQGIIRSERTHCRDRNEVEEILRKQAREGHEVVMQLADANIY